MIDIETNKNNSDHSESEIWNEIRIEDIEDDFYYHIKNLNNNKFNSLYSRDSFKYNRYNIDIFYPKHTVPEYKKIIKKPDSIRYLLSLYPSKDDLFKIQSIILYPRYIEIKGTELVSLFFRNKKMLVLYLHHPHLYTVNNIKFFEFSYIKNSRPIGYLKGLDTLYNNTGFIGIPPLWYILSNISYFPDDKIEKFMMKTDNRISGSIKEISDISFNYSRLGY